MCSIKYMFLKDSQNSQPEPAKKTLVQVFSGNFCKILKVTEYLRWLLLHFQHSDPTLSQSSIPGNINSTTILPIEFFLINCGMF